MKKKEEIRMIKKNIPRGKYVGRWKHFSNQAKNVFTFIIIEAEDVELIGKGISQRVYSYGNKGYIKSKDLEQ